MSLKIKHFCMNCSSLLAFLLLLQSGRPQNNFTELDQLLVQRAQQLGGNFVTLLLKDGKTVYQKETGTVKADSQEPLAFSSKWLTAALVMTFVDEGKLSLDDPVSKFLPIFSSYSKSYITIRHCLSETTGIESETKHLGKILQRTKFGSLEEEVNYFASGKDIIEQPGKEFYYGRIGLNTAGRILEVISKRKSFSKLMQERLFKPLGMKKSSFAEEKGAEDPSGGAKSTANDYMKFLAMLLSKGEFNGKRILSAAAVELMQEPLAGQVVVKYTPKLAEGFQYGFGEWIEAKDNGKSNVISCPGLTGIWPYINKSGDYACIIFTKSIPGEPKKEVYFELKEAVEKAMGR